MSVLVTAFEPFGGGTINASQAALKKLSARADVEALLLPVSTEAQTKLKEAISDRRWDAVLCLGERARASSLRVERVAVNLRDDDIADNSGVQLRDSPIDSQGPQARFATLPLRAMVQASLAVGVPASLSNSAGTFVCNAVMYCALGSVEPSTPAGFVHVPLMPEQRVLRARPGPSLSVEHTVKGLGAMLDVLAAPASTADSSRLS